MNTTANFEDHQRSETMLHRTLLTLARAAAVAASAIAISGQPSQAHEDHPHKGTKETYSAGEPGDPKKPAREIKIDMSEMQYSPEKIQVKRGEQIRFVIRNVGTEAHEFLLATTKENLKHAEAMRKNPDMEHDEPNGIRLAAKASAEVLWKFTKAGTFEYSCLIPNHREGGMIGTVTVK